MARYQLMNEIVALSAARTWEQAKREWDLENVYQEDEPDTCLCGHFPINEICVLRNRENGTLVIVGNVCVKRFLGLPSDPIFQAVKGVKRGSRKTFNEEAISHARKKGWINDWESDFYMDTMRKRKLTEKQVAKRSQINEKILSKVVNARSSR